MSQRTSIPRVAGMLALASLGACAMRYEGKYDWDEGWRVGRVLQSGAGSALPPLPAGDCRKDATPAEVATTRYANVRYQSEARLVRHRIVPIPKDQPVAEGQLVYFNVADCRKGLVKATVDRDLLP